MLVADGINCRAYGDIGAGKVWWNLYQNQNSTENIFVIQYKGDNKVLFAYGIAGAGSLMEVDYDNAGVRGRFYSNKYYFDVPTRIEKFEAIHDQTAANMRDYFSYVDPEGSATIFLDTGTSNSATTTYKTNIDIDVDIFQLLIYSGSSTNNIGYKLIRIYDKPIG